MASISHHPTLPLLDEYLYPMVWQQQVFNTPQDLLQAVIAESSYPTANQFCDILLANQTYQDWVNFTVFGRFVQRSFAIFYRQSEDAFNSEMPDLLRHELMRHAQYLPKSQMLFVGGEVPKTTRQEKLLLTTLNPIMAWQQAIQSHSQTNDYIIVNQISITGQQVLGFAVRHNPRTSERLKCEVLVLDFVELRLIKEQLIMAGQVKYCLRHYTLR